MSVIAGSGWTSTVLARRWPWLAALAAALTTLLLAQAVFQGAVVTADETSYVFQAHCFLDGVVRRPTPPIFPAFEHDMTIVRPGAGWLSRFSPGHALWLMPGAWLGAPRLMSALAAGLSLWLLVGCARRLSVPAGLVAVLLFCSPYFLLMHGTLLSHTSAHLAFAVALWSYLAWLQTRRWRFAALCGAAGGFLFLDRQFTAVLLGAPLALHALADGIAHRNRTVWIGLVAAGLGAALGLAADLAYNRLATGSAWQSPFLLYDPSETLGFGWRHLQGEFPCRHTWAAGWRNTLDRLVLLDGWAFGVPGTLALVAVLAAAGWAGSVSLLLAACAASLWLGYLFFFANNVDIVGPFYCFESLPCLVLLAAMGLQRLWALAGARPAIRRLLAAGAVALAASSLAFTARASRDLRGELAADAALRRCLRSAPTDALVMPCGAVPSYGELAENPRGLDSRPLIANWFGDAVALAVAQCFPDRRPFLMLAPTNAPPCLAPFDRARRVDIVLDAARLHEFTGAREPLGDGTTPIVARAGRDPAHWMACGAYAWLCPGRFEVVGTLAVSNVAPAQPVTLDVLDTGPDRVLAETRLAGSRPPGPVRLGFTLRQPARVEARVHYGGAGAAAVWRLQIRQVD